MAVPKRHFTTTDAVYVYLWWLNQQARKNNLEPLLEYYAQLQAALDSGDESGLQFADPPSAFLQPPPRKPISKRQQWIWIMLTTVATLLWVTTGVAIMQYFDARTGKFFASCAPVIAFLIIYVSGLWRRNPF